METKANETVKAYYLGLKTARDAGREILVKMMQNGAYFPSAEDVINTAKTYTHNADIIAAIRAELDAAPIL